ncbi:MAG: hypothetical protein JWM57_1601 [Phycisphaerales bacterium]|nr:hypothetical protein [Phycisphaerales bacterium]
MGDFDSRAVCDALERRTLFADVPIAAVPTCTIDDNNTLIISGTSGNDRVDVRANAEGMLVRLNADGSQRKRFAPGFINGVKFDGGAGSDGVTVSDVTHFSTFTERVEHRSVRFADGQTTDDFATLPEPGRDEEGAQHWLRRYRHQQKALVGENARTLLIGDSLTERMPVEGKAEWESLKANFDTADLGFSGDTTSSLLFRLQHDLIKGLWPRTIFVSVGTNNIALTDDVASTVRGIRRVLATLKELRPKSQLVLSSILPRGEGAGRAATVDAVNAHLDDLAKQYDAVWSDAATAFPNVKLPSYDYEASSIHLTDLGYSKWAPVIADSLHTATLRAAGLLTDA